MNVSSTLQNSFGVLKLIIPESFAGDVMNKFQYLRGQYQKILRKIKNTPSGSGAQTPQKWEFFSSCSFLQSVYDNCPTESSFIHPDDLVSTSECF